MITTVLPVVFTSSFGIKTPNKTFEGYMYKINRRERGLPFVRAPIIPVARHGSYRLILSFRSRDSQKTNNRLPPKIYRPMAIPSKIYRNILVLPPPPKSLPPKSLPPKTKHRLQPKQCRRMALPLKKALPTITLKKISRPIEEGRL